jgi:selenocysteine lyase/cysteine desulfurase
MSSVNRRSFLKAGAAAGAMGVAAHPSRALSTDEDPLGVRDDFPVTREATYLNTAAVSPIPMQVREAAVAEADGKMLSPDGAGRSKDEARTGFAELFGAQPKEIALLYSTSDGENIVTRALDLKEGDNVVVDELHFLTSFVLYRELERERGIELRIVPQVKGRARVEDFEARADGRTRLVSVAWVSNVNGYRHDLRALAELVHARGGFLFADAIQALGHFPTRLADEGVDFLATGSYKWLLGTFGVAPFYVREEHLPRIRPDRYGHGQIAEELPGFRYRLIGDARKYEYAALAHGAVRQLKAGLDYLKRVGLSRIAEHGIPLARALREGIQGLGFEILTPPDNPSPIVSFVHGRDGQEIKKLFDRENIRVSYRGQGSEIRLSVALFNNRADVGHFLDVLRTIA